MKLLFLNEDGRVLDTYTVNGVFFDTDETGKPVDIEVHAPKSITDEIAEKYCLLGYNYSEEFQCALFGRFEGGFSIRR